MAELNPSTIAKQYTVCLLAAGQGTRMGLSFPFNKALLPLGEKAVLSRIIEKFPSGTRFVIALGFCADQVREFVQAAHPDLNVEFVEVEKHSGPGSGPGRSLLECAPHLQDPFYFVACDTLWSGEIPLPEGRSWMGIPENRNLPFEGYSRVISQNGQVFRLAEKEEDSSLGGEAFIGLAYVQEPGIFFSALRSAEGESELQVSSGFRALVDRGLFTKRFAWQDLGTAKLYEEALAAAGQFNFSKANEFLYFSPGRVVKFFRDSELVRRRVLRVDKNPAVFPPITFSGKQFYAYSYVEGKTLYEDFSLIALERLLSWLPQNLWLLPQAQAKDFSERCREFYLEKTAERMRQWAAKYPRYLEPECVRGKRRPPLKALLQELPMDRLVQGRARFIHGDLQPDNILCTREGFLLLDWRQDFSGLLDQGDLYYDLAKLRGGLLLNYRLIKEGQWSWEEQRGDCQFQLPEVPDQGAALTMVDQFCLNHGLEASRVRLLTGLIFANMAPLHHAPFDYLLWNFAREVLDEEMAQVQLGLKPTRSMDSIL